MSAALLRLTRYAAVTSGVVGTAAAYRYNQLLKREAQELPSAPLNLPTPTPDVIVIGGGVVGIAAAYTCAKKGQKVLVIEPNTMAGQECTSCAAGGMQKSNPVVNLNTWLDVIKCSFGMDYKFFHIDWMKTLSDPFFFRWIFTFSITSLLPGPDQEAKQAEMLKFTKFAVNEMVKFMDRNMVKASGWNKTGSLSVSYDPPAENKQKTVNATSSTRNLEPNRMLLSTAEILKVEPSLRFQENPPQTAKFEYEASAASAERYTLELARQCTQHPNVTFLFNTTVRGLKVEQPAKDAPASTKPSITALSTTAGVLEVSPRTQVLVATGAWVPHLLATADLYAPVYPLKGYAMSLWVKDILKESRKLKPADLPSRVVADKYMYTSRLGDEIRITSIGEFSGWSTKPTPSVDEEFRREAARQFPQLSEFLPSAKTRCGHRPYVSDGLVLMGRCPEINNLLVSCGPGSNGWKMAMGSAVVVQGLAAGKTEKELSAELGFDVSAFGPANRVVYAPWFAKLCRARWNV